MSIIEDFNELGITVTEDQTDSLNKWIGKNYVPRAEFNSVNNEMKGYKSQVQSFGAQKDDYDTQISNLNQKVNDLTKENQSFKLGEKVSKAGVDPKFSKFVISEVSQLVDDKKDFDTALNEYLKENEQFKSGTKRVVGTSNNKSNGGGGKSSNQYMNDAILKASRRL